MKTDYSDVAKSLAQPGVFALLVAQTADGEVILRPIGGEWGPDITEAIRELTQRYPGCRMRLFEHEYNTWRRYFKGIIPEELLLS